MWMLPKDHLYTVSNIASVFFSSWPTFSIVFLYESENPHFPSCGQLVNPSHIFVIWSHITLPNITTASFVQRKYPLCFMFYVYLFLFFWAGSFCQIIKKLIVCAGTCVYAHTGCVCALWVCVCIQMEKRDQRKLFVCIWFFKTLKSKNQ